jgi:hypothetical protein
MNRDLQLLYRYADFIERRGLVMSAARIRRALFVVRELAPPTKHALVMQRVYAAVARHARARDAADRGT